MANRPDGKGVNADRVVFTRPAAERISKAVLAVEAGGRDAGPLRYGVRIDAAGSPLRLATFTGNWQTGSYTTVTLHGSTQTASVYNWCNPAVGVSTSDTSCTRYVVFGSVRGTNSAVEIQLQPTCSTCHMSLGSIDLKTLPGYVGGEVQMLGHNSTGPCLQWYSITTCSTATAA